MAERENALEACEHEMLAVRAKKAMPKEEDVAQMCAAFKAIGEPSRMKILLALMEGEMCVYHLTEAVGSTQSAVSHQLRILRDNRIIKARRDGQNVVYSLADAHVMAVLSLACEHLSCTF